MKNLSDFEKIARKSKRRNRIKTIFISSIVALLSLGLIMKIMTEVTSHNGNKVKEHYLLMSEIAYPNISYTNWYFTPTSNYSGQFHSDRFKTIDGIEVPYESMNANYSLRIADLEDSAVWQTGNKTASYTHINHYKNPMFFNVNHDYSSEDTFQVTKDISIIKEMNKQAVEVAVTFDRGYTYQEIQKKIPDNLLINWYWIGSSGKGDIATLTPDTQYGLKSYEDGKLTEKDFLQFSSNLRTALNKGYISDKVETTYQNGETVKIDSKEEVEDYLSSNKDFSSAKFSGVILTGRAESFAQLENKDWIYASNIGQSVMIQPYHTLTK
nr:anti sigma factor C-terminal domain-containing protein [Streptococcus lutetiensis]